MGGVFFTFNNILVVDCIIEKVNSVPAFCKSVTNFYYKKFDPVTLTFDLEKQ
jgi:hypothetical protein